MKIERKWMYLAVAAALMALISVPSVFFLSAFKTYFSFLSGWSGGRLRPAPAHFSGEAAQNRVRVYPPEVRFVKFALKKKGAKNAAIAADFNDWDPQSLPMKEEEKGFWIASMPLPKGKYRYVFAVDGARLPDPANPKKETMDGGEVSVLIVE
ncbi:MAG: hypothetical protein PHP45_04325 [Elusimicrobiales bacterium]|nr:hypothetical protein [Elusimicrobiales bacterium]